MEIFLNNNNNNNNKFYIIIIYIIYNKTVNEIIMSKGKICEECKTEVYKRVFSEDKWICESCFAKLQTAKVLDVAIPEVVKWIGKCAKQGRNLLFIIPQGQKPFFKHKEKYIIIVRKLE